MLKKIIFLFLSLCTGMLYAQDQPDTIEKASYHFQETLVAQNAFTRTISPSQTGHNSLVIPV